MGRLDGKVALITGGGNGMGREASVLFAAEGARIVVADFSEANGTETVAAIEATGGEAGVREGRRGQPRAGRGA